MQSRQLNHLFDLFVDLRLGSAGKLQGQGNIFYQCSPGHQVGFLEYQPRPSLAVMQIGEIDGSRLIRNQARQRPQERALTAAGWSNQTDKGVFLEVETDALQHLQHPIFFLEADLKVAYHQGIVKGGIHLCTHPQQQVDFSSARFQSTDSSYSSSVDLVLLWSPAQLASG